MPGHVHGDRLDPDAAIRVTCCGESLPLVVRLPRQLVLAEELRASFGAALLHHGDSRNRGGVSTGVAALDRGQDPAEAPHFAFCLLGVCEQRVECVRAQGIDFTGQRAWMASASPSKAAAASSSLTSVAATRVSIRGHTAVSQANLFRRRPLLPNWPCLGHEPTPILRTFRKVSAGRRTPFRCGRSCGLGGGLWELHLRPYLRPVPSPLQSQATDRRSGQKIVLTLSPWRRPVSCQGMSTDVPNCAALLAHGGP